MSKVKYHSIIKIEDKGEFPIVAPTFEVLAIAMSKLTQINDDSVNTNMAGAGKSIFDACYVPKEGGMTLDEIQKDAVLYLSICMQCAGVIEIYKGELKKN